MSKAKKNVINHLSFLSFFSDVKVELLKCVWPTRDVVIRFTGMVIIIALLVGFLLGGLDIGFLKIISELRKILRSTF